MEADYASVSQSQSVHHSGLNDDVSLFSLFSLKHSDSKCQISFVNSKKVKVTEKKNIFALGCSFYHELS